MTPEQRAQALIKETIGDLVLQIATLTAKLEAAEQELERVRKSNTTGSD